MRDARKRLDVVDQSRAIPDSRNYRQRTVGELKPRHSPLTHQTAHERRFFAAFVAPRTDMDVQVEVKSFDTANALAEIAFRIRLVDCGPNPLRLLNKLATYIHVSGLRLR